MSNQKSADEPKKRTKKPSTLKKRILQERYRVYREQQTRQEDVNNFSISLAESEETIQSKSTFPVYVFGITDGIDLCDTDELQEVVNNIKELFSEFSDLLTLSIYQSTPESVTDTVPSDIAQKYSSMVLLTYGEDSAAKDAVSMMHGRTIGGDELYVIRPKHAKNTTIGKDVAVQSFSSTKSTEAFLLLENLVSWEDIVEGDEESLEETKRDILSLCEPYPGAISIHTPTKTTDENTTTVASTVNTFPYSKVISRKPIVSITEFRDLLIEQFRRQQPLQPKPLKQQKLPVSSVKEDLSATTTTTETNDNLSIINETIQSNDISASNTDANTSAVSKKPRKKPSPEKQQFTKYLKALKQFKKPLLCITFEDSRHKNSSDRIETAYAWNALFIASLLQGLQIGGESLRVHCLASTVSSAQQQSPTTFLLDLFSLHGHGSGNNESSRNRDFPPWKMRLFTIETPESAVMIQDFCTEIEQQLSTPITCTTSSTINQNDKDGDHKYAGMSTQKIEIAASHFQQMWHIWRLWEQKHQNRHDYIQQVQIVYEHRSKELLENVNSEGLAEGKDFDGHHDAPKESENSETVVSILLYSASVVSENSRNVTYQKHEHNLSLYLENYVTVEDISDSFAHQHEELVEVKLDLLSIVRDQLVDYETHYFQDFVQHIQQIQIVKPTLPAASVVDTDMEELREEEEEGKSAKDAENNDTNVQMVHDNNNQHNHNNEHPHHPPTPPPCYVTVAYDSYWMAVQAICYFEGLLLGGVPISAYVCSAADNKSAATTATADSDTSTDNNIDTSRYMTTNANSETAETTATTAEAFLPQAARKEQLQQVLEDWVTAFSSHTIMDDTNTNDGNSGNSNNNNYKRSFSDYGLQEIYAESISAPLQHTHNAHKDTPSTATTATTHNNADQDAEDAHAEEEGRGGGGGGGGGGEELHISLTPRKISLYIIAKHAPKLGKHSHSRSDTSSSSSSSISGAAPLESHVNRMVPVATEEINTYLKTLLRQLALDQRILRDKIFNIEKPTFPTLPAHAPLTHRLRKQQALQLAEFQQAQMRKWKLKLRYVCGLKQVLQALKAKRLKLLILAPNTESSVALDAKIVHLLHCAQALEIPVLYGLSRRLLGKALQMSMKQTCVGVLAVEGSGYEWFRKVLQFVESAKK